VRLDNYTICVTGGLGYIGSHTAKVLKSAGANVIVVDRREVPQNKVEGTTYIKGDYGNPLILERLKNLNINGIVHCAGTSLVGPSLEDPSEYYYNNVVKTIKMLDAFNYLGMKPFIVFSSSAAVYGDNNCLITEGAYLDPINPYGNTKMMIEKILADYSNAYGFKYFAYRYFNAAGADPWSSDLGPEENDTHIIPRIFEAYQQKKPFHLYGRDYNTADGTCVRDYIHVADLALAHLRGCIELGAGSESKVYNLGTGTGYSNQEIIDAFIDEVGAVDITVEDRREGDPDSLVADASLIQEELNWRAEFSDLNTIIKTFKDFYEKYNRLR